MRAAIYLRVSTDGQTTANQERALRAAAERIGHEIVAVYLDAGISGSNGRDQRPGFDAMHKDATRRRFGASDLRGVVYVVHGGVVHQRATEGLPELDVSFAIKNLRPLIIQASRTWRS